jgi:hypothetical protein
LADDLSRVTPLAPGTPDNGHRVGVLIGKINKLCENVQRQPSAVSAGEWNCCQHPIVLAIYDRQKTKAAFLPMLQQYMRFLSSSTATCIGLPAIRTLAMTLLVRASITEILFSPALAA